MTATDDAPVPLGEHYATVRWRVGELVSTLSPIELTTPVPACPGWTVHDVVAHLLGIVEDALAGLLTGPPDEAQTAAQVARHRGAPTDALLAAWHAAAPAVEDAVTAFQIWPALVDVVTHELDVLAALGRPLPPPDDTLALLASWLAPADLPVGVEIDGRSFGRPGAACTLRTTAREFVRVRLGRRSRAQVAALDWDGDPGDAIDALFVFGPATTDLVD